MTTPVSCVSDLSQARAALEAILRLVQTRAQYVEDTGSDQQIAKLAQQALEGLPGMCASCQHAKPIRPDMPDTSSYKMRLWCAAMMPDQTGENRGLTAPIFDRRVPDDFGCTLYAPAHARAQETQKEDA